MSSKQMTAESTAPEQHSPETQLHQGRWSARERLSILAEFESYPRGDTRRGELLRRHRLYTSHISKWREQRDQRLLGVLTDYENLHELVSRINLWIEQHHIDVLNVETVLVTSLPNETEASPKVRMDSQANALSTYQIVRVWYRESVEVEAAFTGQTTRLSTE